MHAKRIVVIAECVQLPRRVDGVPDEHTVEIFAANGADEPFDERMRNGDAGNRLNLVYFEYTKVRKPTVKAE